jgi:hypothetical protein
VIVVEDEGEDEGEEEGEQEVEEEEEEEEPVRAHCPCNIFIIH